MWDFAVHAGVGMLMFGMIAIPAISLDLLIHQLHALCIDLPLDGIEPATC